MAGAVKVERAFKREALCADKGVIFISEEIVLQERQPAFKLTVEGGCLFCVPEHVMIAAQENFAAGQRRDKRKVLLGFRKPAAPRMVACHDERVVRANEPRAVFLYLFLMMLPDGTKDIHGF